MAAPSKAKRLAKLRRLNLIAAVFFAAQALLLLALAGPAELPVTGTFLLDAPGTGLYETKDLFELRIDWVVAAFLLLAAVDHLAVGSFARGAYERNVPRGTNPARWWEYSVSASLMVVLIAMLAGASDAVALAMIFGANAAMILFGLVMERTNLGQRKVSWSPFVYGCVVGAVPWIGIAIQLGLSQGEGDGVPAFVYVIFATLFVLFNGFAVNMFLAYRARSTGSPARWKDPLYVELAYVILSFTAKTALAWQVYGGSLAGG